MTDHTAFVVYVVLLFSLALATLVPMTIRWLREARYSRRRAQWYIDREEAARKIVGRW